MHGKLPSPFVCPCLYVTIKVIISEGRFVSHIFKPQVEGFGLHDAMDASIFGCFDLHPGAPV